MGKGNLNMGFCDAATPRRDNTSLVELCKRTKGTAPECKEYCAADNSLPGCEYYYCKIPANQNEDKCATFCNEKPGVDFCQHRRCMTNCLIFHDEDFCLKNCKEDSSQVFSPPTPPSNATDKKMSLSPMALYDSNNLNAKGQLFSTSSSFSPWTITTIEGLENGEYTTAMNSGAKERYLNTKTQFNNEMNTSYHLGIGILVSSYFLLKTYNP